MCICAHAGTEGCMGGCAQVYPLTLGESETGQGQSLGSIPRWVVTFPSSTLNPGALKWGGRAGAGALLGELGGVGS